MTIKRSTFKAFTVVWIVVVCMLIIGIRSGSCNALIDEFDGKTYTPQGKYGFKNVLLSTGNKWWLTAYTASQALDIASTQYALNNGCEEANPLYGKDPNVGTMLLFKTMFSVVAYYTIDYVSAIKDLQRNRNYFFGSMTVLNTAVSANNYRIANNQ